MPRNLSDINRANYRRALERHGLAFDPETEKVFFLSDGQLITVHPVGGVLHGAQVYVSRRATLAAAIRRKEDEEKAGRKVERHVMPEKPEIRPFLKEPPVRFLNLTVWYAGE
jgi:hypothetical protein